MKFKQYLKKYSCNLAAFCREHKLPYSTIRKVVLGKDVMLSVAYEIELATDHQVTLQDLVSEVKMIYRHERLSKYSKKKQESNHKIKSQHDENRETKEVIAS